MNDTSARTEQASSDLLITRRAGELNIELRRAQARNAITAEMLVRLISTLEAAARDDDLRVITMTAQGDHFSAGMDIAATNPGARREAGRPDLSAARTEPTRGPRPRVTARHRSMDNGPHRLIELVMSIELPVITLVRGTAAGLGCALALASDFAVVSDSARFVVPYVRRGFTPDSGTSYFLPRLVGVARAREMLLRGQAIEAARAADWGLITETIPDADLLTRFQKLVDELSAGPTVAFGLTKWLLNQDILEGLSRGMRREGLVVDLALRTDDFKEGIGAFLGKRPPDFRGR